MTNRVDFYQGECKELAIPAGRCEVFVEGVVLPLLEVVEIVREGWPGFGYAKLRYNPAAYEGAGNAGAEQVAEEAAVGKPVEICRLVNTGIGEVRVEPVRIFAGRVEQIDAKLDAGGEVLEITARDFSAGLDEGIIDGKRVATGNGKSVFWLACDVVFNEDGQPNASTQKVQHNGWYYTGFAEEGQEAKYWSIAEVLEYLLREYVVCGRLQVPPAEYLGALTGGKVADEFEVEGKSVLAAIQDCCEQAGLEFIFSTRQSATGPREQIAFYLPGQGRAVELNHQYAGEKLGISRTNVCELASQKQNESADSEIIETIDVQTPIIATHYQVGDRITVSPDSRDVLGVRRDNRSTLGIERVKIDFEKQCTDLRILRSRANS